MRKLFSFILALMATTSLWAQSFQSGDLWYSITSNSTVEVTRDNYSNLTTVTIPETVNYNGTTYNVTSIGRDAFQACSSLTSITIPNSVTSIGLQSFWRCSSLTSITIPNSVTSIGDYAFYECSSLISITIGNSVTSIGDYAFSFTGIYNNYSNWENDVLYVDGYLLRAKTSISGAYTIKENTRLIAGDAFGDCSSLTSVTIPNSVTSIGNVAFYNCSSLTSITIPNSVTSIGNSAFQGCSSLNSIVVEEDNTIYDSRENCNAIIETATNTLIAGCQNTVIPNSITSIGDDAFFECSSLTSISIPNSITSIGNYAFCDCSSLTSIAIPNSVTSIGDYALGSCIFVKENFINNSSLDVEANNYWGAVIGDIEIDGLLIRNDTVIDCRYVTSVIIPNSVTSIGDIAFRDCSSLVSVTIPNSVTSIGNSAFWGCSSLTSITIPNSVTSIGNYAFLGCSSLTSITIPNSVTSIGNYAFQGCSSLTSITIPNSVTSIGNRAFLGCSSLTSITIPNSVTSIGDEAFSSCYSLTSISIPNSVTNIGRQAFYFCNSLDTVTCLAMTPPAMEENVFSGCDNPTLFVPCQALLDYQVHEQWGHFTNIECIGSEDVQTEEVVIELGTTTIIITWPTEEGADTYTIVIMKDGEVVCTLTFNSEGQLISIVFAPGRDSNHAAQYAEQVANGKGYRFTVTGLEEGTHYTYNIDVKNTASQTINSHAGEFTTQSTTAVENIEVSENDNAQKLIRNGQLIILRDGVEYNAMGQEL